MDQESPHRQPPSPIGSSGRVTGFSVAMTLVRRHWAMQCGDILLHRKRLRLDPEAEMFLYMASRAQLVREVIQPALQKWRLGHIRSFPHE